VVGNLRKEQIANVFRVSEVLAEFVEQTNPLNVTHILPANDQDQPFLHG